MRSLRRIYLAVALTSIGAFVFVPVDSWAQPILKVGIGWLAAAVIVLAVRGQRGVFALPWYLFAFGVFANSTGILVEAVVSTLCGAAALDPSMREVGD